MRSERYIKWAMILTAVWIFLLLFLFKFSWHTGFTSLIRFGVDWAGTRVPELNALAYKQIPNNQGYDGQFYAQLALHPHLKDPILQSSIDSVHYRARRILMPALAFILGAGHPFLVLHLFSLINLVCWWVFSRQLLFWIKLDSWENFGRWFFCVAGSGVLESMRASLTDLPALCLILLSLRLWMGKRRWSPALALAGAALTRETSILAGFYAVDWRTGWGRMCSFGLLATCPLLFWVIYLHQLFPNGDSSVNNFSWPFLAMWQCGQTSLAHILRMQEDRGRFTFGLLAIPGLTFQFLCLLWNRRLDSPWWRLAFPYLLLFPFLGQPVWDGYWAVCRTILPMTLAFNLLLPRNKWFWPLLLLANLPTTLHSLFRLAF